MPGCSGEHLKSHGLGRRAVVGKFDGGTIGSDGGGLLLREVESRTGILRWLARQFTEGPSASGRLTIV